MNSAMEIGFWHYLHKEHPALPLKQRVPEVALFRGSTLQACYYSNQRGLLQPRTGVELTHEALLDRLYGLASKQADRSDLGPDTPVAILRRAAPVSTGAPPTATVLRAAECADYLKQRSAAIDSEEWSLQSIALPAEDLRVVAVYSRDALGQERIDVVGRSFKAMYQGAHPHESDETGAAPTVATVPDTHLTAVEAKALALVRYVQHFHQMTVEGLIVEFVIDAAGRIFLHAFWRVSLLEESRRHAAPEVVQSDNVVKASSSSFNASTASTALPSSGNTEASLGDRPRSAENFGSTSRPTSATPSRPNSASRERPSSQSGLANCPESLGSGSRSLPTASTATSPPSRRLQRIDSTPDPNDLQIIDDAGGDDEIDAEIERLQALRKPQQRQRQQRPTQAARTGRQAASSSRAGRNSEAICLLELWEAPSSSFPGGRFVGETVLAPPSYGSQRASDSQTPRDEVLELRSSSGIRPDVRKEHENSHVLRSVADVRNRSRSLTRPCSLRITMSWGQWPDSHEAQNILGTGTLHFNLSRATFGKTEAHGSPRHDISHVRAQLWACTPQAGGCECQLLWTSRDAEQVNPEPVDVSGRHDLDATVFTWAEEAVTVAIPAVVPAQPSSGVQKRQRPSSARARLTSPQTSTVLPPKARPSSARLSGKQCAGSTAPVDHSDSMPTRSSKQSSASSLSAPKDPTRPSSQGRHFRARPIPTSCKSKLQRPASAKGISDAQAGAAKPKPPAAKPKPPAATIKKKRTLHSKQILSRFEMERDARTRLISVLARQLERHRDLLPIWHEQREIARSVVGRVESQVQKRTADVDRLLLERGNIEKFYHQKHEEMSRCLQEEQRKAKESMTTKRLELEGVLEQERQTTESLLSRERRNEELRRTLDVTVEKLESVQSEISDLQAQQGSRPSHEVSQAGPGALAPPLGQAGTGHLRKASPELLHVQGVLESQLSQKEQIVREKNVIVAEIRKVEDELEWQHAHACKLELFVRELMSENSAIGCQVDPALKREAANILASRAKLEAAKLQRPSSPSGMAPPGRRCAAGDEYDVRWNSPWLGTSVVA